MELGRMRLRLIAYVWKRGDISSHKRKQLEADKATVAWVLVCNSSARVLDPTKPPS